VLLDQKTPPLPQEHYQTIEPAYLVKLNLPLLSSPPADDAPALGLLQKENNGSNELCAAGVVSRAAVVLGSTPAY
jgi:hypothetical protein